MTKVRRAAGALALCRQSVLQRAWNGEEYRAGEDVARSRVAVAGQWPVPACLRDRTRLTSASDRVMGAAPGQVECSASIATGAGAGAARSARVVLDVPAQRGRLDVEPAGRLAGKPVGRVDASTVMQLSADAIWLATGAMDMRAGSTSSPTAAARALSW
jgi:hypothetical protein